VLAALSGELSRRFLEEVKRPVTTFGVDQGQWQAATSGWASAAASP
jgi:hypothetical protein